MVWLAGSRALRAGCSKGGTLKTGSRLAAAAHALAPVLVTAVMFSVADICGKVALSSGTDVTSMMTFRGVVGLAVVFAGLRLNPPAAMTPAARRVALGLGVLLTANLYLLFKAIELVPVSVAILVYFVYPLLTGIVGAATGIDRLSAAGAGAAAAAFGGLVLIVGAAPGLAGIGVAAAVGAALCRAAMLLITRATLAGADARVVTWYTLVSSTVGFAALSLAAGDWHWPAGAAGWTAFVAIGFATTIAIFTLYVSTQRIGPFGTALFMNLEPLMTSVLGVAVLGERLSGVQMLGGATMIAALSLFQMRR